LEVKDLIAQIPEWARARDLQIEPMAGLTNRNYRITADGERFVLRISGENTGPLGINRVLERQALAAASRAGIGPEVVRFLLPEGHLVTRLITGRHWTVEEYREPETLRRVVETAQRLHSLPAIRATFSPFQRVEAYARQARAMDVPFPPDFSRLLEKMRWIQQDQARDTRPWLAFCHNDLFFVNVLDDGATRFVDWEFAGMGDIYYDLATLVYAYDTHGPLSPELEEHLLACYFGQVERGHRSRLAGMKFMVLFFTAMWALLQNGLQVKGMVTLPEGFDCLAYADHTFGSMRGLL
jgi:thiamine kinase-like enzyme